MSNAEEAARLEAVMRVLSGEPAAKVAADLGRTDRWVRKWVARYDPADEGWAKGLSRAPNTVTNRTSAEIERSVLKIRAQLANNPWTQVGSMAIAWEMTKLGLDPPESRTIERILARANVAKRRSRPDKYVPKGTPYPGPVLLRPNARHEVDLVGPRHLEGGVPFYALNAIDLGRHRVAIEIVDSKEEWDLAEALVRIWSRLGIPGGVKLDNGQTLQGRGRHLSLVVRLACTTGVRVRFIPFGEPWRNPVIEHFNDVFDKRFFRTDRFSGLDHLREQAGIFEAFHNSHHRYSALKGTTPDEWEKRLNFTPRLLDSATAVPTDLPRRGQVEFVRLIRSDRLLKVLNAKIEMPEKLVHRYVTATLHLRTQRLVIQATGIYYKREVRFPIN